MDRQSERWLPVVVALVHEAFEWAESTIENELKVTELTLSAEVMNNNALRTSAYLLL